MLVTYSIDVVNALLNECKNSLRRNYRPKLSLDMSLAGKSGFLSEKNTEVYFNTC